MPSAVPAGVYGRRVPAGGIPIPAAVDPSAAFRITMAAIDPSAEPELDEDNKVPRATLKIIRIPFDLAEDDDDYDEDSDSDDEDHDYDSDDIEAIAARLREGGALPDLDTDMSEDDDSDNEKNGGPSDPAKSKKVKQEALSKKIQEEIAAREMELDHLTNGVNGKGKAKATAEDSDEEDEEDEDDYDDEEPEEFVLCTLDPEKHYQQPLDITVREEEEVYLVVEGTHDVFVTGNYVAFPMDDEDDEHDGLDELDYDLSPDEDELDMEELSEGDEDELDNLEDPRITELDSDEEDVPKLVASKKGKNKRPADSDDEAATLDELINKTKAEAANGEKLSKKQAKKLKKNDGQAVAAAQEPGKKEDKKKVQFAKNLEQGPTGSPKVEEKKKETPKQRTVSGVTIEDKKEGKGRAAKKGDRIEMRYIGKLKNGKQFDANKKGKPFSFKLGVGEVIKGWDIGVAGMMPGSERRLVIPSGLAYGKKALPDIPANSDLVFDIKCISVS